MIGDYKPRGLISRERTGELWGGEGQTMEKNNMKGKWEWLFRSGKRTG